MKREDLKKIGMKQARPRKWMSGDYGYYRDDFGTRVKVKVVCESWLPGGGLAITVREQEGFLRREFTHSKEEMYKRLSKGEGKCTR